MIRSVLLALLLLLPAPAGFAQEKTPLTAETMWQLKRLSAPSVSPDGRHTALAVSTADRAKDTMSSRIWLIDNRSGAARAITAEGVNSSNPQFSPNGAHLLFESRREGDEVSQLYLLPLSGGEAQRLTNVPTGVTGAKWFPDGRQVAFLSRVWTDLAGWEAQAARQKERKDSKTSGRSWDRAPLRHWDRWLDDREVHLYSIAVEGGEPQPITLGRGVALPPQDPGAGSYDIAPDGREVALVVNTDASGVNPNSDVVLLSLASGETFNITPGNPAPDYAPRYSPDGRWLAYSARAIPGFYADRAVLTLFDRESGAARRISEAWDRSIDSPLWTPDSRSLIVAVDDAGTNRLYRITAANGRFEPITRETSFGSPALARDGSVLVALNESSVLPPTLVRVDPRSGRHVQLSRFNDEILDEVAMGRYESVTYAGANGAPIQMWVVYPPGFDPGQQYPLYLLLHGGPHNGISDGWTWRWNAQIFAGWGYVTGWHNFHGSSGFGQAFTDSITADWATLPYQDTIKAAEWFASRPFVDAERMGAGGGSYGGYLASLVLGREHPFKTLVAHAAVYNHYTQYGADFGASKRRHGEFWEQPEQFRSTSPHYAAGNFDTPTLVIHGELDYRVPVNHGVELFNTLQNRGVRSRFVYYPDENHWILKQNNSIHWYREKQAWLAEFLGGSAP
jgi:dipeptidyl aminopeptidase/acylaminoacyl peptidase